MQFADMLTASAAYGNIRLINLNIKTGGRDIIDLNSELPILSVRRKGIAELIILRWNIVNVLTEMV